MAHPEEWEVWVPSNAPDFSSVNLRDVRERLVDVVQPVLEGPSGGRTLDGPLQVIAPDGLLWDGGVLRGPFRLQADAYGSWTLLEQIPVERYLEGVVPHEIGAGSPSCSAGQAVRRDLGAGQQPPVWSRRLSPVQRHSMSGVQRSAPGQWVGAGGHRATSRSGVATDGQPIQAWYHATNGGVSAGAEEAWSMDPLPYVQARADGSPAGWVITMPLRALRAWGSARQGWCLWRRSSASAGIASTPRAIRALAAAGHR